MEIKEFSGLFIDEKTYVIHENESVLMIDAVRNNDLDSFLESCSFDNLYIILTHEHIDHIYAVNYYQEKYNCTVLCSEACKERVKDSKTNLAKYKEVILGDSDDKDYIDVSYGCKVDQSFDKLLEWEWENHTLYLVETPGHSPGSICVLLDEEMYFTGDTLLMNDVIITRLPGGSKRQYTETTKPFLKKIPAGAMVYPGHGKSGKMQEFSFFHKEI